MFGFVLMVPEWHDRIDEAVNVVDVVDHRLQAGLMAE